MGDVIKFRAARKKLDRKAKEKRAADNRAFFGLSKADKDAAKAQQQKDTTQLDGHKLSDTDTSPD